MSSSTSPVSSEKEIHDIINAIASVLKNRQDDTAAASSSSILSSSSGSTPSSSASTNASPESSSKYSDKYFNTHADEYIEFTYASPTIYHVIDYFSKKLTAKGFKYVSEKDSWDSLTPGKYFTVRNSSLAAFIVGKDWTPEKGVGIIGSHIDALTVILKPNSTKEKVEGYELLGVAPYAGTLGDVWWDRDLGVGGRLLVKDPKTGKVSQKLVDSTPNPIAHIPTLAPHFGTPAVGPFNKETQAVPVIGFSTEEAAEPTEEEKSAPLYGKHSLNFLRYISKAAGVKLSDIVQWDLQLYDIQKGTKGGLNKEFVFAPRIDDRVCSFAAIYALLEADEDDLVKSDAFSLVGLFDNEEIGSATRQGIKGGLIESVVSRVLSTSYFNPESYDVQEQIRLTYSNTIILSADVNHLLNPNFSSVYLEHHKPVPNSGITIALDPNGHMATDSTGLALVEELARINKDPIQYFQIRNDSRSGGTIGPSISLQTGARTIDLGIPQLSMHSIRATVGTKDIGLGVKFFAGFFANWRKTYDNYTDL
ncbi:vacuolar aminopeptidase I precursor [Scheffersomyces xylosifermentans]|uniref:vacuolar aminopeptidase I precursor n=1 Tax=Scheffersomyces xylosifermentans TaxID=1304137 RepID=UPI00315CE1E9